MDETMVNRRSFVKGLGLMGGVAAMGMIAGCSSEPATANDADPKEQPQAEAQPSVLAEGASWELVAHVEDGGLIEGLNFSQDGTLWFIDVVKGRIHKVVDGEAVTVHDNEGKSMPNGAKFIDGTTMLITDRSQGLCRYDTETGEYSVWVPNFNGTPFNGLNDLVLDGQGGAYFTDPGQSDYFKRIGCVYYVKYDEDEPALQLIQDGIAYPNGITLSPDGQSSTLPSSTRTRSCASRRRRTRWAVPRPMCSHAWTAAMAPTASPSMLTATSTWPTSRRRKCWCSTRTASR